MAEGQEGPSVIEAGAVAKKIVSPLPSIRKFNESFGDLDMDPDGIKTIRGWWKNVNALGAFIDQYGGVSTLPSVPPLEKKEADVAVRALRKGFDEINVLINSFVGTPAKGLRGVLANAGGSKDYRAEQIYDSISDFYELQEEKHQIRAVCEAIEATKHINSDPLVIRQKIAQWAFTEMISLVPYGRWSYQAGKSGWFNNTEVTYPTTIDTFEEERAELIRALSKDLWNGKETGKWKRVFNNYRRVMDNFEFDRETKTDFNFVFDAALGEASLTANSSTTILGRVEAVWQKIGEEPTLEDSWGMELENSEMHKETDDEEDDEE